MLESNFNYDSYLKNIIMQFFLYTHRSISVKYNGVNVLKYTGTLYPDLLVQVVDIVDSIKEELDLPYTPNESISTHIRKRI